MSQAVPPPVPGPLPVVVPVIPRGPYELTVSTPCLACGYDLHGLRTDSRCPECGTPIGRSVHGSILRFAEPRYVRKLARGVVWILWGILTTIVGAIAAGVLAVAGGLSTRAMLLIAMGGNLVGVYGTWLATTPDPGRLDEDWQMTARKVVRFAVVTGLVHYLLLLMISGRLWRPGSHGAALMISAAGFVALTIGFIGTIAQFAYFRSIALRVPSEPLAARTRMVMWGFGIGYGIKVVILDNALPLVSVLTGRAPSPGAGNLLLEGTGFLAALAMLVFGIWWLILLLRYRRRLIECAQAAEATWASQTVSAAMGPSGIEG